MDIKILDNIHRRLYSTNREANDIWRMTQPEIDDMVAEIWRNFNNTRATLADKEGLEIWERTYDILPNPAIDTPQERLDRVLEAKRTSPPFTEAWFNGNPFDETIPGRIAEKFPDGAVVAILEGLRLWVFMDVTYGGLNEHGFTRREFRELVPWIRSWCPTNLLVISKAIASRQEAVGDIFVAGVGFRYGERAAQIPERDAVAMGAAQVSGVSFRQGWRAEAQWINQIE